MRIGHSNGSLVIAAALCAGGAGFALAQSGSPGGGSSVTIPASSSVSPVDAGVKFHTNIQILAAPAGSGIKPQSSGPPYSGYFYEDPASIACIYSLQPQIPGCNPNVVSLNPSGGGRAIAVVDAYDDPNAYADLGTFSAQFGVAAISPASFSVIFAPPGGSAPGSCTGSATRPGVDSTGGWEIEESLDIEWAHAMAPQATLYLVEAQSNSNADLYCAVTTASNLVQAAGGGEVSMSWGGGEFPAEISADSVFTTAGVVYFASTGDGPGVIYPAASPNVVSVGGTTLSTNPATGAFISENAWQQAGGGPSAYEPRPAYQNGIAGIVGSNRGAPDIAAVANPYTGVWVLDNFQAPAGCSPCWYTVGGTSVAAPVWAGMVNASNSFLASTGAELTALYAQMDFTAIDPGSCGPYMAYFASTGWNFCTGPGSLIPPAISSLSTTSAAVGTSVTISGTNFGATQGSGTVTFNGTAAAPSIWSATSIVAPVPVGASIGPVVVVAGGVVRKASNGAAFTVLGAPSISGLNPSSALVGGPEFTLTVNGAGFVSGSTVEWKGTALSTAFVNAEQLTALVPAGLIATVGMANVTVLNPAGAASDPAAFTILPTTPTIISLSPASGAVGAPVTISGANFGATQGASTVTFNGTAATPTSWSAASIVAPVPAGATSGNVVVTAGGVASNGVAFTVLEQANVSSIFPDTAIAGGPAFTLYVYDYADCSFQSGSVVNWNGTPLATTFSYSCALTASVPASLIATVGSASITVTNPGEPASASVPFAIVTKPVTPTLTSATAQYSWYVTGLFLTYEYLCVDGSGWEQGITFWWNGTSLGSVTSESACIVVPNQLMQTPGPVSITATNPGSTPSQPMNFAVPPLRTLTSISPSSVSAGSGSFTLTVNGTGFASGDQIAVYGPVDGGTYSLPATFISSTQLQATVPASFVTSSETAQVWVNTYASGGNFHSLNELPLTVGTGGPVLSITKTHSGNFTQGEQNANYTVTVSNASGAAATFNAGNQLYITGPTGSILSNAPGTKGSNIVSTAPGASPSTPTSGQVTVNEHVPAGLTLVSMAGTGWSCTLSSATCTRSDVLAGGASYPTITVTVNVSPTAASPVTNQVQVSGGGSSDSSALDVTTIIGTGPAITGLTPATGGVGTSVTIAGANFGATQGTSTVTFNGILATPTSWSATSIVAPVPAGTTSGNVVVTVGGTASNGVPFTVPTAYISSIFPDDAVAGGAAFTLYVMDHVYDSFQSGAVINWNGAPLATNYNYDGELTATVPASLIATTGTASITVTNPGESPSNSVSFPINATPVTPTLTSVDPTWFYYVDTGLLAFDAVFPSGSGFEPGVTISWNGINLGPLYNSNGDGFVLVPYSLFQTPGPASITATNPGGAPSQPMTFTVPALRTLTSISPASVTAGSGSFTLTVNGTGFASGDSVDVSGPDGVGSFGQTTFISSTQLQTTVPASLLTSNAILQVFIDTSLPTCCGDFPSTNQLPLTVGTGGAVLNISSTHSGNFTQGQQNATYTVTVNNASGGPTSDTVSPGPSGPLAVSARGPGGKPITINAPGASPDTPTSGQVTVTEFVPSGLTLVSMAGTGWSCSGSTCTRSDVLAGGASYPAITVTVNVSSTATSPVANQVNVSGGGAPVSSGYDVTIILPTTLSITSLSPTSGAVGTAVTIAGTGFGATQGTSTVTFNGTAATPTSWSATSIVAPVPVGASDGPVVVTVGVVASNGVAFTVLGAPGISGLSPSSASAGGPGFTLTVNGAGFVSGSTVEWGGTALSTAFVSSTQLTASITAGLIATPGTVNVTVLNPSGAASDPATFTILTTPTITSLSPTSGAVGTSVTIAGANFGATQGTSTVTFNGTAAFPSSWSAASIMAPVPAGATSGPVVVTVGGVASNGVAFTVPPTISSLIPYSATAGGPAFTLLVNGGGFVSGCAIEWGSTALSTVFVSAAQLTASVTSGLIVTSGAVNLTVACTGLPTSPAQPFAILAPSGQTWTQLAPTGGPPAARYSQAAVFDPVTAQMIVYAGWSEGILSDVWSLSTGATPQWTNITPAGTAPAAREGASAIYDSINSRMTIFGGEPNVSCGANDVWTLTNANSVGGTPAWTQLNPTGTAPAPRFGQEAAYDPGSNRMIVFGGYNCSAGVESNDVWVLTNANGLGGTPTWIQLSPTGTLPAGRDSFSAVYDVASDKMIIFGGLGGSFNDVWILSDANGVGGTPAWTQLTPTGTRPAARFGHTAVYDSASNHMTVFGGTDAFESLFFNDAWVLSNANGSGGTPAWTQLAPLGTIPPARIGSTAVFAPSTNQMIVFGGDNFLIAPGQATLFNDVWTLSDANAVISIGSLSPNSATAGGAGFTLTVNGSGFIPGSVVQWNGTPLTPTTYVSATQLTAPVGSTLLASSGSASVTVVNPSGATSAAATFTILPPPAIASLSPASGVVGTAVTIAGTNFGATQGTSTVTFNGTAATPTSWSATSIVANVPAGATSGNVVVTVGGVASNGVAFTVPL